MSQPTGREGLELLVGTLVLVALTVAAIPLGRLANPDFPWFLAGILGFLFIFCGVAVLFALLGLAWAIGSRVLNAVAPKIKPWDGSGAPDDL